MSTSTSGSRGITKNFSCSIISGGESVQVEISEYRAKVLIVDDDLEIAEEIANLLMSNNFVQCQIAGDALQVMDIVESDRDISIIITNLTMPGLDGLQIIKKLREICDKDRDFTVIVTTDHEQPRNVIRALQLGATEIIARPVLPEHLLQAVDRASTALELRQLLKANTEEPSQATGPLPDDSLRSNQNLQFPPLKSIASNRTTADVTSMVDDNIGAQLRRPNNSVLIVDDDVEALEEMEESLQGYGLKVYAASNVGQALKIAKEQRPEFIIMDYLLSGYTGIQAIDEIHKFLPETQVIMISAFDDLAHRVSAADFGVVAVLKKPLSMESIGRFIKNKLSSKKITM